MQRIMLALVVLVALTLATPAHATLNACAAAKKQCVAKKAAAILKCHTKDEKPPGQPVAKFTACVQKAKDKFDGGATPAKGCFAKVEAKFPGGCLTTNDVAALEATVDAFIDDVVCQLDPGAGTCPVATPTPTPTATPTPNCSDGIKNGSETGVDCGGGLCPACPLGQGCAATNDCVATAACSGGTCVCAVGQSDCNSNPIDACEVSTANDPTNCGGCGLVCAAPNGTPGCTASICTIAACNVGRANCNNVSADGCEIDTTSNHSNCGSCGLTCSFTQNCVNSVCQ